MGIIHRLTNRTTHSHGTRLPSGPERPLHQAELLEFLEEDTLIEHLGREDLIRASAHVAMDQALDEYFLRKKTDTN